MNIDQTIAIIESAEGQVCRKCGRPTQKRTHDEAKSGKLTYYAWWFRCKPCGWMYMPPEAIRQAGNNIRTVTDPRCAPFSLHDRYIPDPKDSHRDPKLLPWD